MRVHAKHAVTLLIVLLCGWSADAARETTADVVQRIVDAAFPELATAGVTYQWQLFPQPHADIFRDGGSRLLTTGQRRSPALGVDVLYGPDSSVQSIGFTGELVSEAANGRLFATLTAHPSWGIAEIARSFRDEGARYGPDRAREFRAALDLHRLENALGPVSVAYVDFAWQFGHPEAGPANIKPPVWRVAVRPRGAPRNRCHILAFEPYGGRLKAWMPSTEVCRSAE